MAPPEFDGERVATHPLFAGGIGALLSLRGVTGKSWGGRAFYVFNGLACAYWLGPWIATYMQIENTRTAAAVSFLVGMFAVSVVDWLWEQVSKLTLEQVIGWLPWTKKGQ